MFSLSSLLFMSQLFSGSYEKCAVVSTVFTWFMQNECSIVRGLVDIPVGDRRITNVVYLRK